MRKFRKQKRTVRKIISGILTGALLFQASLMLQAADTGSGTGPCMATETEIGQNAQTWIEPAACEAASGTEPQTGTDCQETLQETEAEAAPVTESAVEQSGESEQELQAEQPGTSGAAAGSETADGPETDSLCAAGSGNGEAEEYGAPELDTGKKDLPQGTENTGKKDLPQDAEDTGKRSEKLDLAVKLTDGTVCEVAPMDCPARLTSGGKTYPVDYAGGIYQVTVPAGTDTLLVQLNALPDLTEGETVQSCAFFSRWDGYLAEQGDVWYLYPDYLDGGTGVYTAASEKWQSMQQVWFYPTEFHVGEYTLPLEKFLLNQETLTREQVSVYGAWEMDARYAEICIGIFDEAEGRIASALLLVKLGGDETESATEAKTAAGEGETEPAAEAEAAVEEGETEPATETKIAAGDSETEGMTADNGEDAQPELMTADNNESVQPGLMTADSSESAETEILSIEETAADSMEYAVSEAELETVYGSTGNQLADLAGAATPQVGSISGEWQILGLARSGQTVDAALYSKYLANVVQTVTGNNGVLHAKKYTEYSRVILALTSIGADVTDVGGYNLLEPLADYDQTIWQGINGAIFALIAFDSHNYEIPAAPQGKTQTTREGLINCILSQEISGGGWAMSGNVPDPDITAMAIQGLAPYCKSNAAVKSAVDRGLAKLSALQQADGGYSSYGSSCSESCAQVIVALTALGIDPQSDPRFIKNGKTVLDGLMMFSLSDDGFCHVADAGRDQMATEQAYYALTAYDRFKNGENSLYDMTDVVIKSDEERAAEAEAMFYALPSRVTLQHKEAVRSALTVYNSLGVSQKSLIAQDAIVKLLNAQQSLEKLEVENVEELIAAIGTVTLAKENVVNTAAAAYNLLSETQKAQVSNGSVLQSALEKLNALKAAQTEKPTETGTPSGSGSGAGSASGSAGSTKTTGTVNKNTGGSSGKTAASGTTKSVGGATKSVSVPISAAKKSGASAVSSTATGEKSVNSPTSVQTPDYSEKAMEIIKKIQGMVESDAFQESPEEFSDQMTDEAIQIYRQYDALSQPEKLAVEQEPEFESYSDILNCMGRQNHVDQISGVNLEENDADALPWYVQLVVNPQLADESQMETIHQVLGEDCEIFSMNDLHFVSVLDGSAWEPEEILRVRFPMVDLGDYENAVIIHLKDDGTMEFLEAKASGSYLEFDAPGFSVYGIAGVNCSVEELLRPKEELTIWPWAAAGGAAAILLLILILVNLCSKKKRKAVKR